MGSAKTDWDHSFGWPNRILLVSILAILWFTLYPFRIDVSPRPSGNGNPFLLGASHEEKGYLGTALNILLFVPFGFGLSEKLRERGTSHAVSVLLVFAAGAIFSYGVEFTQIYVPGRDSQWPDVLTNSSGAVAGAFLSQVFGAWMIGFLSKAENIVRRWASRIAIGREES